MTPGVRTEPELTVRIVRREGRTFVVEDEHYEGSVIGSRQLKPDGSWTGWSAPCDVVDETYPVDVHVPLTSGNYTQIFTLPSVSGTTTTATPFLNALANTTSTSMLTLSPGMLATITPTS